MVLKEPSEFQNIVETFAYQLTNISVPPESVQRIGLQLVYNHNFLK